MARQYYAIRLGQKTLENVPLSFHPQSSPGPGSTAARAGGATSKIRREILYQSGEGREGSEEGISFVKLKTDSAEKREEGGVVGRSKGGDRGPRKMTSRFYSLSLSSIYRKVASK